MRTAVVYYSLSGNSKLVAEYLSKKLEASIYEVVPAKNLNSKSFFKYVQGGQQAVLKKCPPVQDCGFLAENYDLIIFCSPVWACSIAPALRTFIRDANILGKDVTLVASHKGMPGAIQKGFEKIMEGNEYLPGLSLFEPLDQEKSKVYEKIDDWIHSNIVEYEAEEE